MQRLAAGFWDAYKFDIETRMADEGRPDLRKLVNAHEFGEGPVMATNDVRVTALRNVHPPITESFALKFDFPDRTIVFSGDTAYFPPLAAFARGADILVHEVMYAPALENLLRRVPNAPTLMAHLKASHTLADEVGRLATEAGVKKLVLSHLVPADDPSVTEQTWIDAVRTTWKGDLVVGRDLMEIKL
jgi:ribonuclease BN (tRNA processing enzyme)